MKKIIIAAASMIAIIAVRMVLSVAFNEQAAEVFGRVSVSFLFFYFICQISKTNIRAPRVTERSQIHL